MLVVLKYSQCQEPCFCTLSDPFIPIRMPKVQGPTQTTPQLYWQWRRSALVSQSCWWRVTSACVLTRHTDTVVGVSSDESILRNTVDKIEIMCSARYGFITKLWGFFLIFSLQASWTTTVLWIMTLAASAWQRLRWPTLELVSLPSLGWSLFLLEQYNERMVEGK